MRVMLSAVTFTKHVGEVRQVRAPRPPISSSPFRARQPCRTRRRRQAGGCRDGSGGRVAQCRERDCW